MDHVPETKPDGEDFSAEKIAVKVNNTPTETQDTPKVTAAPAVAKTSRFRAFKKKRWLIGATAGIALVVLGSVGFVLSNRQAKPVASQTEEQTKMGLAVSLIDGTAKVSSDGQNWETLTTDSELTEGDIVSTDVSSRVILAFDDGSAVRLDESSTLELSSLSVDNIRLDNDSGTVYSRVVASERSFSVTVDGTAYKALGTAFNTINKDTVKGVQVIQSSVEAEGMEAKVEEGKQTYVLHSSTELVDTITDISAEELKSSSFMVWNMEKDEAHEEFKDKLGFWTKVKEQTAVTEPAPVPASASMKLTAKNSEKGTVLSWTLSGASAPDGFKVVRSKKSSTPTYGTDEAQFVSSKYRTFTWASDVTATFYYRVCIYVPASKTCSLYSNAVQIESVEIIPEQPVQGTVSLALTGTVASWTDTGTAPHGWKLLVDESPNPVYGGDLIKQKWLAENSYDLAGLGAGTYYVRVCKYTASSVENGCTNYSNQETLIIP